MQQHLYVNSETLTDGSKVWSVFIGQTKLDCLDESHAYALAVELRKAIEAHT